MLVICSHCRGLQANKYDNKNKFRQGTRRYAEKDKKDG
jgi:hypothetical protein